MADHVEPGVSLRHKDDADNGGLNTLACVGNTAKVISGEAKGDTGWVTGKHGGIEHVLVWFTPELLEKMNLQVKDGILEVPIAAKIPAHLMGSGIGSPTAHRGDYDIMTADPDEYVRCGLDQLRFGDLVLLEDCDNRYGRGYLKGAVSVGVVIHSDCVLTGHGPVVTTLFTCSKPLIKGMMSDQANIGHWLGIL